MIIYAVLLYILIINVKFIDKYILIFTTSEVNEKDEKVAYYYTDIFFMMCE